MIDFRKMLEGRTVVASVSGGKDSAALSLWLTEQGIEHRRVFADTGWEHPLVYEYLRGELTRKLGPIEEVRWVGENGETGMVGLTKKKAMFPSRKRRFCTEFLKIRPLSAYIRAIGGPVANAVGIRRQESQARAAALEWEPADDIYGEDTLIWRPLATWSEQDVIDIHRRHGLGPNPLYLQGARRVGCWPCIFSAKGEIRLVAELTPERIDLLRNVEREVGDLAEAKAAAKGEGRRHPRPTFFQAQGSLRGRSKKARAAGSVDGRCVPIDEVVAWSKTKRGGVEFEPFVTNDDGCVRWGLCESTSTPGVQLAPPAEEAAPVLRSIPGDEPRDDEHPGEFHTEAEPAPVVAAPRPLPLPVTAGGWKCIVADPPWSFRDKGSRIAPDQEPGLPGIVRHYSTMTLAEIAALPVAEVAADDALLFLWTTSAHLLDGSAAQVAKAWGFEPKASMVWVKCGAPDPKAGWYPRLHPGMGHYVRNAHELIVVAARGKAAALIEDRGVPSVIFAPRRRHSQKPEIAQDRVERLCPGPRLELFARRNRPGWTSWGLEAPAQEAA